MRRASAAALTVLLALGCGVSRWVCPARGGAPWTELRSEHFLLRTDLPEEAARSELALDEQSYRALSRLAFSFALQPPGPIEVLVFARPAEFDDVAPRRAAGFFRVADPTLGTRATIVLQGRRAGEGEQIFNHELTHEFATFYFPQFPRWLSEGLADYYSTLELGSRSVRLGIPPRARLVNALSMSLPTLGELTAQDRGGAWSGAEGGWERSRRYAAAWSLVHLVLSDPELSARFQELRRALLAGRSFAEAWAATLAGAPDLELRYLGHASHRQITVYDARLEPEPLAPSIAARTMSDEEVHLLWAWFRRTPSAMRSEIDEAAAAGPNSPEPLLARGLLHFALGEWAAAQAVLERARTLRPDDPRVRLTLARVLFEMNPRRPERVEEVLPPPSEVKDAGGMDFLARLASAKDPAIGAVFAMRAVDAHPNCWFCYDTLAQAYRRLERLEDAVEAAELAVNLVPEGRSEPEFAARLAELRAELAGTHRSGR
jgi:tetratricopeptide (TPR) repeat protein